MIFFEVSLVVIRRGHAYKLQQDVGGRPPWYAPAEACNGSDQPIRAIQPAGRTRRPPTGCSRQTSDIIQTDVRQHHRL